jgi:hypothetical protein
MAPWLITHRDLAASTLWVTGAVSDINLKSLPREIPRGYILIVIVLVRFLRLIASQAS